MSDKLFEAMKAAENATYGNGEKAADDPSGFLIQTMANPDIVKEEPAQEFDNINTLQGYKDGKRQGKFDNINKRDLAEVIFDPALTKEELEKLNANLKTTIIIKPDAL